MPRWYSPDEWNIPVDGADINLRSHIDDATGVRSVAPEWSTVWYINTHQVNAGFSILPMISWAGIMILKSGLNNGGG